MAHLNTFTSIYLFSIHTFELLQKNNPTFIISVLCELQEDCIFIFFLNCINIRTSTHALQVFGSPNQEPFKGQQRRHVKGPDYEQLSCIVPGCSKWLRWHQQTAVVLDFTRDTFTLSRYTCHFLRQVQATCCALLCVVVLLIVISLIGMKCTLCVQSVRLDFSALFNLNCQAGEFIVFH